MEDEKRRNKTPTVEKSIIPKSYYLVNYHLKIILIKIIIYHQNQHQKKHILNLKKRQFT